MALPASVQTRTVSSKSGDNLDHYVQEAIAEIHGNGGTIEAIQFSAGTDKIYAMIVFTPQASASSAPGYVAEWYNDLYDKGDAAIVHIKAPEAVSLDLYLAEAGSISGYVYEVDGVTPLPNASVYAFPVAGHHPGAGANTGPDGSYTIEGLPSGNYRVQAAMSDRAPEYYDNAPDEASATEVWVNAPGNTPGVDFALNRVAQ